MFSFEANIDETLPLYDFVSGLVVRQLVATLRGGEPNPTCLLVGAVL